MRIFVTRVSAPTHLQEHGTKWQVVLERDGVRECVDPERVLLRGPWTFARDETGTPTVWLVPMADGGVTIL